MFSAIRFVSRVVTLHQGNQVALDIRMVGVNVEHHTLTGHATEYVVDLGHA